MANTTNHMINSSSIKYNQVMHKTEKLLSTASNRYKITVQVARRAKHKKYENMDIIDQPTIKPIIKAIMDIVDEITSD